MSRRVMSRNQVSKRIVFLAVSFFSIRQEDRNPFVADGELSRKAELIISKSTISRSEVRISDPDNGEPIQPLLTTETVTAETVTLVDEKGDRARTPEKPVESNGASHTALKEQTPPLVEAEVTMVTSGKAEPLKAEQVELKTKDGCCTLQ